jgi:hypothetical protein
LAGHAGALAPCAIHELNEFKHFGGWSRANYPPHKTRRGTLAGLDIREQNKNNVPYLFSGRYRMSKKDDYHVVPNSDRGGWDVKREGADRSSGHFDRKSDAMDRGRDLARENKTELVEHGRDGRIQDSDSYGNDPNPPRDKKH